MKKLMVLALIAGMVGMMPARAEAANPLANIAVSDENGNLSNGTLTVKRFLNVNNQLMALATLSGVVNGREISRAVQVPVTARQGGSALNLEEVQCDIVTLDFGPLDLTVAGFHIQLAPVSVAITAEDAPAELVCTLFDLLGVVGTALDAVVGILNTILGALGGLG